MDNPHRSCDFTTHRHTFLVRDVFLLLSLASLLVFINLGSIGLTDRDEGSNAEAAREMLETRDWVSPTLNYEPRFAKPAFAYWIISTSYAVFGINEFAARFPSACLGIALILLQYGFLLRVCGRHVALLGAFILLLNLEVIGISRMVLTDPELVFFTTFAAFSFWWGLEAQEYKWWRFLGLYVGMACAMLAKGPVGMIIPLLAIIPYLGVTRQWTSFWRKGYPLLGLVLFCVIAAPWYVAMFAIHGENYLAAAQANTTGRFASPMEGHGGTILFYIPVLCIGFFPWSAFLPASLYQSVKDWKLFREDSSHGSLESKLALFSGIWIIGLFMFFTLSATRLPHYVFPLFPAASVLVALFWARSLQEDSPPGFIVSIRVLVVLGYSLGLALASAPAMYKMFLDKMIKEFPGAIHVEVEALPVAMGVLIIAGTMLLRHALLSVEKRHMAFGIAGGMIALFVLGIIMFGLPQFHRYFIDPPQNLATVAGFNLQGDDRLIQFGRKRPSLAFYARRKVYQINPGENEKFVPHLDVAGRKMIVLQSHLRSRLPESVVDYPVVLERDGFSLLASEPLMK